jgi:hypothetical protein
VFESLIVSSHSGNDVPLHRQVEMEKDGRIGVVIEVDVEEEEGSYTGDSVTTE